MDATRHALELAPEQLRRVCDPRTFTFTTTVDLPGPARMVGQARALEAIAFALEMTEDRYNLFVAGAAGTGRHTAVMREVERVARERPAAQDWCYVHNFDTPDEPRAIALPAGRAKLFAHDTDAFVLACRRELRHAFEADSYASRRDALLRDVVAQREALLHQLEADALALGFMLQGSASGIAIVPVKVRPAALAPQPPAAEQTATDSTQPTDAAAEPEPLSREEFEALPATVRDQLAANHDRVQEAVARVLPQVRTLEEQARQRVRQLDHDVAEYAVGHLADDFVAHYRTFADVVEYVRHLRTDIVAHADVLRGERDDGDRPDDGTDDSHDDEHDDEHDASASPDPSPDLPMDEGLRERPAVAALLRRYRINVFVARVAIPSAPYVQEVNPTSFNLLGHVEYGLRDGLPFTDHMLIKPGALHRANGGFLILQANDLLSRPRAWEAIKRTLRFRSITIENLSETQGAPASAALRPEPIACSVRVVLLGEPEVYAALMEADPDFRMLFKVRADFDTDMPRTREAEVAYAQYVGAVARVSVSPPFTPEAVAMVVEEGSRHAEDQERLTALLGHIRDICVEAGYWSRKESAATTTRAHVEKAIAARWRRESLASDKLNDLIRQGTVLLDTDGEVVGQVNGLTVLTSSTIAFGKPIRITARTSAGVVGVVDVQREIQLSGPSHSKGVLILAGYLLGRYAHDMPLSLSASIAFEQVYDEVDGDSASSSELYALLSSLAGLPIRQSLAVTGSVNQRGEVQAIGGATQKIEGFFTICRDRGLTGHQGVIIPRANIRNLMLRTEVVDAVRSGLFHIYAVSTIDEGISLLTGIPAGQPGPDGRYLEGTVNARVQQALRDHSERMRAFGLAGLLQGPAGTRAGH